VAGGSIQVVEHRLVDRMQPRREDCASQPGERSDLGFVADDDGARAVWRGAERERALGVHASPVGSDGERTRSLVHHDGAAEFDRVRFPLEDDRVGCTTR
jgi:hypothetical protein